MESQQLKELLKQIYKDGFLLTLGTVDEAGVWVCDVTYVFDDEFNLYWLSKPDVRHSKAIEKDKNVACTIHAEWMDHKERAVQIAGVAERIDGSLFELEKQLKIKTGSPIPTEPGEILKRGSVWYKLTPTKIELIHLELFGKEKQLVDFRN